MEEDKKVPNEEPCHHHHGPMDGPGGPHKEGVPPHILKEIMDLKEKVGKLEGMIEVLLRKNA
jgi:hypothetical protein